jgi:hypothetical protein
MGREDAPALYYASAANGSSEFAAPRAVPGEGWVPPSLTKLAVDEQGTVWLAHDDRRADTGSIRRIRIGDGRVFQVQQIGR